MVVGKTSEKQRLWDKFVERLRERNVRTQLRQLFQQKHEKDWRAEVAKLFKKDLSNMARACKNESSKARFKAAAVQELLLSAKTTCGADDRPFVVDEIKDKDLGLIATRAFSASVQTLQDQYGIKAFIEVLKEEQWEEAVALNYPCLFDDAGFTGILFGPLALLNESKTSQLELKPLSTAEPGQERKRRSERQQSEALEQSSESECESEPDSSCKNAQMCLRSTGSIGVGVLAKQQAQAEETAREALQRLKAKQNSKTADPRKRKHKQVRLKGEAIKLIHFNKGDEITLYYGEQYRQHWTKGEVGCFRTNVGGSLRSRRKQKSKRRCYEG
eukprot:8613-Heterococcus_DN1.PRE.2